MDMDIWDERNIMNKRVEGAWVLTSNSSVHRTGGTGAHETGPQPHLPAVALITLAASR